MTMLHESAEVFRPLVSVIVPTYNREAVLCQTLTYLFEQDYPHYEILVVDQTREHHADTNRFLEENKYKLRYVKLTKPSLTKARNVGVAHARGEIVLFLDDDIVPINDLISRHVQHFQDQEIGAVAGQVVPPDGTKSNTSHVGIIEERTLPVGNFNSTVATDVLHAPGGNASVRRDAAIDAGLFERAFGGTAIREETDFYLRISTLGYRIIFEPAASILHLAIQSGGCGNRRSDAHWYFWYAHNSMLLALRHRALFSLRRVISAQFALLARRKGPFYLVPWLVAHLYALFSYITTRNSLVRWRRQSRNGSTVPFQLFDSAVTSDRGEL